MATLTPTIARVPFAISSPFEQGIQFTIEASRRTGEKLTPAGASRYWTVATIKEAMAAPGAFAWKICQKTLAAIHRFEAGDHYDIDFLGRFAGTFRLPLFAFGFIFPLAMVGIVRGFSRERNSKAAALLLAAYASTLVVFFSNGRYRLPMVTLLIPFAVYGAQSILASIRAGERRNVQTYLAIAVVFLVTTNLPIRATDDKTAYYNTHALILKENGRIQEALDYWTLSSEMNKPFSAFANLSLAAHFFQEGDLERGSAYLAKIGPDSFAAAQKYEMIGDLLNYQGDLGGAAGAYEKSLGINSGQRRTLAKLIRLYRKTDRVRMGEYQQRLRYVSSFYDLM